LDLSFIVWFFTPFFKSTGFYFGGLSRSTEGGRRCLSQGFRAQSDPCSMYNIRVLCRYRTGYRIFHIHLMTEPSVVYIIVLQYPMSQLISTVLYCHSSMSHVNNFESKKVLTLYSILNRIKF
jgi:hypothetical protein